MVTMQDCEKVWERFNRLKEEAEQYMFPSILVWDLKITPLYKDLQENWDEHHGEIFMREHGIMVIPSAIPGGKSSWNIPSKN